jgi:hypothetical protein
LGGKAARNGKETKMMKTLSAIPAMLLIVVTLSTSCKQNKKESGGQGSPGTAPAKQNSEQKTTKPYKVSLVASGKVGAARQDAGGEDKMMGYVLDVTVLDQPTTISLTRGSTPYISDSHDKRAEWFSLQLIEPQSCSMTVQDLPLDAAGAYGGTTALHQLSPDVTVMERSGYVKSIGAFAAESTFFPIAQIVVQPKHTLKLALPAHQKIRFGLIFEEIIDGAVLYFDDQQIRP